MGRRRKAREIALQMLFYREFNPEAGNWKESFWKARSIPVSTRDYAETLVSGVLQHQTAIDALIQKHAQNWTLDRMTTIDRNILRIAVYELKIGGSTPVKVGIDEAIDIAKRYGDEASGSFVNGILDQLMRIEEPLIRK